MILMGGGGLKQEKDYNLMTVCWLHENEFILETHFFLCVCARKTPSLKKTSTAFFLLTKFN